MSKVPEKASTTPPHRSWPNAVSTAAAKVSAVPTTVIWFGATGSRWSSDMSASAWRRTHASNRVVNIDHFSRSDGLSLGAQLARFLVDSHDLRGNLLPGIAASLLQTVSAHPEPQLLIARQDDERRAQLRPTFRAHGQAVATRLQHRHVAIDLGGDDRQGCRHSLYQDDPETLSAGRPPAEHLAPEVRARQNALR